MFWRRKPRYRVSYTFDDIVMLTALWVLGLFLVFCVIVMVVGALSPSCEERGGTLRFSHMSSGIIMVGKVFVPTVHEVFVCDLPKEKRDGKR